MVAKENNFEKVLLLFSILLVTLISIPINKDRRKSINFKGKLITEKTTHYLTMNWSVFMYICSGLDHPL